MEIFVGKIINTFGIKGELKVVTNFEMPEKVFKKDQWLMIGGASHQITSVRYHKEHYLITIDHLTDINLVLIYKGQDLYFNRESLNLKNDQYLLTDLIGFEVYDEAVLMGQVSEIIADPHNPLIKIDQSFYIPLKGDYIEQIDLNKKQIKGQRIKELKL